MEINVERIIGRPAGEVTPFFFEVVNNPVWQSGMKSCEWLTDPPVRVGSTYRQEAEFRGKPVLSTFEVTELTANRMRIESIESTFPIQVTRIVEPIDDVSCRVSAHISGRPGGVMRILTFVGARIAKRSIGADYDRLVSHFEDSDAG